MKKITFLSLLTFLVLLLFSTSTVISQITTPTNFNAGAAVVDMGIADQTDNNGLRPYGLVVDLVQNGIPVNWIINPNKNFENGSPTSSETSTTVSLADLPIDGFKIVMV